MEVIHSDALLVKGLSADVIFTDPPYEMPGKDLAKAMQNIQSDHLVLLTSMRQLLDFSQHTDFNLSFDFVFYAAVPKKSKSKYYPHYVHQTGVYMIRNKAKSLFDRGLRQRSDSYGKKGYWETVFMAHRNRIKEHALSKNLDAVTDLLGSFSAKSVIDPFAGSGTTAMAAFELGMSCVLIEKDEAQAEKLKSTMKWLIK